MVTVEPFVTQFTLLGKLGDLIFKSDDRLKYLLLLTEEEQYWIEVAKEIRKSLSEKLELGCLVRVTGMRKYNPHKEKVKYKAYGVELLEATTKEKSTCPNQNTSCVTESKVKVLFCRKSNCWQNGGQAVYESLKAELQARGIAESVDLKTIGCLKHCKQAPNLVMNKVSYHCVRREYIPLMVEKHLSSPK